jgi:hypothetical protein
MGFFEIHTKNSWLQRQGKTPVLDPILRQRKTHSEITHPPGDWTMTEWLDSNPGRYYIDFHTMHGTSKRSTQKATPSWKPLPSCPAVSAVARDKLGQLPLLTVYVVPV